MSVLIRDINETLESTEFKPFDDSNYGAIKEVSVRIGQGQITLTSSYLYTSYSYNPITLYPTQSLSNDNNPIVLFHFSGNLSSSVANTNHGYASIQTYTSSIVGNVSCSVFKYDPTVQNGATDITASVGIEPNYRTLTGSCTMEGWFNFSDNWGSSYKTIFSIEGTGVSEGDNTLFALLYKNDTKSFQYYDQRGAGGTLYSITTSNLPITTSVWTYIAAVKNYDATPTASIFYYINGNLAQSAPLSTQPTSGTTPIQTLWIGGNGFFSPYYTGSISSFKITPSYLSSTQILENYNYAITGTVTYLTQSYPNTTGYTYQEVYTDINLGINTTEIDAYRQGIEITQHKFRFNSASPKIWAGNIKGYSRIQTYGDALSYTDFEQSIAFEETQNYNPVDYINSIEDVYFADLLNDIPIENKEANIQPLTIRSRNGSNELSDPSYMYSIKGNIESGDLDTYSVFKNSSFVEQIYNSNEVKSNSYFSDNLILFTISGSDTINLTNRNDNNSIIVSYKDNENYKIIDTLTRASSSILTLYKSGSDINLDEDIRQVYNKKSMPAGNTIYGAYVSEFGTDSIAFDGFIRGC